MITSAIYNPAPGEWILSAQRQIFMLLLQAVATRWQNFLAPNSVYEGTGATGAVLCLGCELEWDVPEETPEDLCLLTSSS